MGAAATGSCGRRRIRCRNSAELEETARSRRRCRDDDNTAQQNQQVLTPAQFKILRQEGTEYPFSSPLNGEKRGGIFVCAGCALPLFSSQMKYDSGTGWPSFFTLIPGSLTTKQDFKLIAPRTEYHCVRCGGHQGHIFDDGPPPTGLRYCNNGVALRFIPQKG
ncbi:MAG: peptide-methionine (R)-S-oxide reductase MsrB [Betaproteobacteria bacterium]|nr:MAG: peptide-methionine (R)-S-oxide reductase MsrB [Betaproteobacteria bacterium]